MPMHWRSFCQYVCTTSSSCKWWGSWNIERRRVQIKVQYLHRLFFRRGSLIFELCFSMLYHFCPIKLTFQIDSAFMFVISGLIVLSLYNGTRFKECTIHGEFQLPVHSNNFFMFFIVPLYIFNYCGSLYFLGGSYLSIGTTIIFITCLVAYILLLFYRAGKILFLEGPT